MGRVRITHRVKPWVALTDKKLDGIVLDMATDIHRVAGVLSPKLTRALVNSGRIERKGNAHYSVIFGGGSVPYAKRRHYENKKNPGTLRYLERGGDSVSNNFKRYIKNLW